MAILLNALTTGFDATDRTSSTAYTTASITATANRLTLLAIMGRETAIEMPNSPTLGGTLTGTTWDLVASIGAEPSDQTMTWLYRSMSNVSRSGTVTITPALTQEWGQAIWSIVEFSGVDTGGSNGSNAIVQSVTGETPTTQTSLTLTLAAFANSLNRPYLVSGNRVSSGQDFVPGTNFSEIHQVSAGAVNQLFVMWASGTADTTADFTWTDLDNHVAAIAIELRAALDISIAPLLPPRRTPRPAVIRSAFLGVHTALIEIEPENFPCTVSYT